MITFTSRAASSDYVQIDFKSIESALLYEKIASPRNFQQQLHLPHLMTNLETSMQSYHNCFTITSWKFSTTETWHSANIVSTLRSTAIDSWVQLYNKHPYSSNPQRFWIKMPEDVDRKVSELVRALRHLIMCVVEVRRLTGGGMPAHAPPCALVALAITRLCIDTVANCRPRGALYSRIKEPPSPSHWVVGDPAHPKKREREAPEIA